MFFENCFEVMNIHRALEDNGYPCWLVGGCVRDALLGSESLKIKEHDIDMATSATPAQMTGIFTSHGWTVLPTGLKHGTVTVRINRRSFEVTTFRVDGAYGDGRHPDAVKYSQSIEEDLSRRDFTINAMAWHPAHGLLDLYGGQSDLESGLIRTVGSPDARFTEDALRMLRAVRFAAKLGFSIESSAWDALCRHASAISRVAHERCASELMLILCSPRPEAFRQLHESGLLGYLLPEIDCLFDPVTGAQRNLHHVYTVGEHTIRVMQNVPPEPVLRLAAMLHDSGKPSCRKPHPDDGRDTFYGHPKASGRLAVPILKRLCIPKSLRDRILPLIRLHDSGPAPDIYKLKCFLNTACSRNACLASRFYEDWRVLKRADILGQNPETHSEKLVALEQLDKLYRHILETGQPYALSQLAVNGTDLEAAGLKGQRIGHALEVCMRAALRHPNCNNRSDLLRIAERFK